MNLPRKLYILIRYILANSFASVQVGKFQSASWRISRGVRQGGVLSAYLFNIYINSILECVSSNENGCKLGIEKRNVQAYADDIVMFCPTSSGLQELINVFTEQCIEHELVINYGKTKALKFVRPDDSVFMYVE